MTRRASWALLAALSACAGSAGSARSDVSNGPAGEAKQERGTLTYADGSGNAYVLEGARLEYVPVTPATSSSGLYHGGAPFVRTLSPEQLAQLHRALDAAVAATGSHVEHRVMGSGQVGERRGEQTRTVVLAPGSAEKKAIEDVLARLRPGPDAGRD